MYNLWIPVMNRKLTDIQKNKLSEQLKRVKPETVMLVFWRVLYNKEDRKRETDIFLENKSFLESEGFNVGAWLAPTIGYGSELNTRDNSAPFTHLKKFDGNDIGDAYCPLDDRFVEDFCEHIKTIAATGVDKIMFEDDFTFTGGKTCPELSSCCCERHMAEYSARLGEAVKREELCRLIYKSGANKYRRIWFEMQGDILSDFCKKIEKAAHSINPKLRIGLSANASSYIQEGKGINELAEIIAGDTRPFIRLTGAPYWQNMPLYSTNIEAIRLQTEWCGEGIDLYSEGDTFPRPRHWVSGNRLEMYDMIIRADGRTAGTLKYMLDYNSSADYETGYIDRHIKNREAYAEIEKRFVGETVGLGIFEYPKLLNALEFSEDYPFERYGEGGYLPLVSQLFTGDNSIPVTYGKADGATLVFGENARYIDSNVLSHGAVLDAAAAKILFEKGIDVGFTAFKRVQSPNAEFFCDSNDQTTATTDSGSVFYEFALKPEAEILSRFFCTPKGLGVVPSLENINVYKSYPACYIYENSNSQRFMVYAFSAETVTVGSEGWCSGVFKGYFRQQQLADGIKYLQNGRALPAMCFKNPELYILCKRSENGLTVGLWNIFSDSVLNPEIKLDGIYSEIDCYNCNGEIEGDTVKLKEDIPPYGYAFFTVK